MKAIFKKAYHFTKDRLSEQNSIDGVISTRIVEAEIRMKPGLQPQEAPDWVKDTSLFKCGVSDRMIIEV
jgi:hypothetical protein